MAGLKTFFSDGDASPTPFDDGQFLEGRQPN